MQKQLSHILWIGGSTDAGKTTIAQTIAQRHNLQLYHYDQHSNAHMEQKAKKHTIYRTFLKATIDERWIHPEPEDLLQFLIQSFQDSFPLVVKDLQQQPTKPLIIAEGFAFLPDLIAPTLSHTHQAVWLIPTETFKWESMKRRQKPSFRHQTSNPQRATQNLFKRDMLLANLIKIQTRQHNLTLYETDGSRTLEEMTNLVEAHFQL